MHTSYIICSPATFFRIVQSVRNPFITGLGIQYRLQGLFGKACFHIAPVVFCYITIGQIISIAFSLPVTAMSTLEHIKIEPVGIIEPGCRHGSTKWVESHQMVLIDGTNCTCQGFPNFCFTSPRVSPPIIHTIFGLSLYLSARKVPYAFASSTSICPLLTSPPQIHTIPIYIPLLSAVRMI